MTKQEQIEEMAKVLIDLLDRETVDKFIENEKGDLVRIETYSLASVAEALYNAGYRRIVWHKVADGDFPKRHDGEVCAIPVQAYYIDRYGIKSNGPLYYFFIDNTFHSIGVPDAVNVIAWTELPKYEEVEQDG